MVVQHNLRAMNSNRMLGITSNTQAKSTEKLSSGFKVNRAADDAAGLAISERMRKQVRGLTRGVANAQDGISCVQTAEGALNEIHDMLQRINELGMQAANGTNSTKDVAYLQSEVDALTSEISRIKTTAKFNDVAVLDGFNKDIVVGYEDEDKINISCDLGSIGQNYTLAVGSIPDVSADIDAISELRADLGAVQNRLEHTVNNLNNVVENTTAAESQIRDTDMATEMVKYSNNNILAQAGTAMLAQSNQANQNVLSLLQ